MQKTRNKITALGAAAGLGTLLMVALDARQARQRMAVAGHRARRWAHAGRQFAGSGLRDLAQRGREWVSEFGSTSADRSGARLAERVRHSLPRWVSRPEAIGVAAFDGRVTLTGEVLAHEEDALMRGLAVLRGVEGIDNRLEARRSWRVEQPLDAAGATRPPAGANRPATWTPGPRLLGVLAGTALAAYGLARRGVGGAVIGAVGAGLTTRAVTNRELRQLIALRGGRGGVDFERNVYVDVPPEAVFGLWADFEQHPRFMARVREATLLDDRRVYWVVRGAGGAPVEWVSRVTRRRRPELLAWSTEFDAPVEHAGIVRFDRVGDGTRVSVRLTFHPPPGEPAHAVSATLGDDLGADLAADLDRMKSLIETGIAMPPLPAAEAENDEAFAASGVDGDDRLRQR